MYKSLKMMYNNVEFLLTKRVRTAGKQGNRGKREKRPLGWCEPNACASTTQGQI